MFVQRFNFGYYSIIHRQDATLQDYTFTKYEAHKIRL
jgi:hypothetical protein